MQRPRFRPAIFPSAPLISGHLIRATPDQLSSLELANHLDQVFTLLTRATTFRTASKRFATPPATSRAATAAMVWSFRSLISPTYSHYCLDRTSHLLRTTCRNSDFSSSTRSRFQFIR